MSKSKSNHRVSYTTACQPVVEPVLSQPPETVDLVLDEVVLPYTSERHKANVKAACIKSWSEQMQALKAAESVSDFIISENKTIGTLEVTARFVSTTGEAPCGLRLVARFARARGQ